MKKFKEEIEYKQLSEKEKEELKKEMYQIFVELKMQDYDVKPKDIAKEVLVRYNVVISPQTVKAIMKKEDWNKKLMVATGSGVINTIKETAIDEHKGKIDLRAYERDMFRYAKAFFQKRFKELQELAEETYIEAKNHPIISKERWKALTTFFQIHDRQMEMLKMIGIEKIFEEMGLTEEQGLDMEKIIEVWEIANENAKIIEEIIERNQGNILDAEIIKEDN